MNPTNTVKLKPFYNLKDGAALLGFSYNHFHALVRAGRFGDPEAFKMGRVWRIPVTALVPGIRFEVSSE